MLLFESINCKSSLITLLSTNKGDFDICALVYDLCTENYEEYLDKDIFQRMLEVKEASPRAYKDLKIIIKLIQQKFVSRGAKKENTLIFFHDGKCDVSHNFDADFIYKFIRAFYSKELSKFNI